MSVENKVENLVCLWPVQCLKCFIVKTNDHTSYAFSLYTNSPCSNVYLIIFIWKICFFIQSTIKKIVVVFKITFKTVHVLHMKMTKESTPPPSFPEMWKSENVQSYYLFVMENRLFDEAFQVFHWHSCVATHFEKDTHFEKKKSE